MNFKRPNFVIDVITSLTVLAFFLLIRISGTQQSYQTTGVNSRDDRFLMSVKPIPDSISHKKYIHLLDSAKTTQRLQNGEFGNLIRTNLGNLIATSNALECDNCFSLRYLNPSRGQVTQDVYYLDLPGWTLKNPVEHHQSYDLSMFYVKNDTGYIRGFNKDKPVKFRYDHKTGHVLIPVAKSNWNTLNTIFYIVRGVAVLWFIYLVICSGLFLRRVSKGLIFTKSNLHTLLVVAATLLALPVLKLGLNYLLRFIFSNYFTTDLMVNNDIYTNLWMLLFSGLVVLRLYQAFAAGKQLKEDQDLTI